MVFDAEDIFLQWYSTDWSKRSFLKRFGETVVNVAEIPYSDKFTTKKTTESYLRNFTEVMSIDDDRESQIVAVNFAFIDASNMLEQVEESIDGLPDPEWMTKSQK